MRKLDFLTVFAVLALFAGCDYIRENRFSKERAEKNYRTAMEDYRAGRIDQAVDGLEKVCQQDPVNASARFQLGCPSGRKEGLSWSRLRISRISPAGTRQRKGDSRA